jgi:uncharacterized linocin/CFP29 family protein
MNNNNGRELLDWSQEVWDRLDKQVHGESLRTEVASKFLPPVGPLGPITTVQSDTVEVNGGALGSGLGVDETAVTPLAELSVEFTLTSQQVEREAEWMTAGTLATRATNLLSQGKDVALFQGDKGIQNDALFQNGIVRLQSGAAGTGLINVPVDPDNLDKQFIKVHLSRERGQIWGENIFDAVAEAYSKLQSGEGLDQAHNGPYACVVRHEAYGDAWGPTGTLTSPADRINPLVTKGFYGTGNVPELTGFVVSVGGNTMDLVVGTDPITAVQQQAPDGRWVLRVFGRWALRFKDSSAIQILLFEDPENHGQFGPDRINGNGNGRGNGNGV